MRIGKELPIRSISAGKAILAHLPDPRIQEIIGRHRLEERTENTIPSQKS
jgi:DNA-binding IclR family transcriptional regulator